MQGLFVALPGSGCYLHFSPVALAYVLVLFIEQLTIPLDRPQKEERGGCISWLAAVVESGAAA
jgi:hypothetical protein